MNVGHSLTRLGRLREADWAYRRALATAEKLVADHPGLPSFRDLLTGLICMGYTCMLEQTGRLRDAETMYRRALAGQEALMKDYPTVARYRKVVFQARSSLAEVLLAQGRPGEAADLYCTLGTVAAKFIAEDLEAQDLVAWFLATCPDPQFRDGRRAARVAMNNVERALDNGAYWVTLGAARYGAGDWRGAVQALEKAARFPSGNAYAPFLHAMAHWRLGQKDPARRWYERGVAGLETQVRDLTPRRLRAEAERLLGVSGPKR
jgi:tetratricopeptide (TPR) repeat protein